MIKEYIIEINLNGKNIKHYENLCYLISRKIDKWGDLRVKIGTKICVYVFDLPKGSGVKITAICNCCGKERILEFKDYTDICSDCYNHSEKRKLQSTGENNASWNPNLTDEEREFDRTKDQKYNDWAKEVKERDNFKCVIPGCNNHDLESHHLDNWHDFPESRYDLDNGITLCLEHHTSANGYSFHTIYGKIGNIKEQYDEWIEMFI